jgi:hypothetical protein
MPPIFFCHHNYFFTFSPSPSGGPYPGVDGYPGGGAGGDYGPPLYDTYGPR